MSVAVIAEKPSVARDIARVLGANERGEGCYRGGGYTVSWAIGHLVALAEPHEMNPAWKAWRREYLPMLPSKWPLKVLKKTRPQFRILEGILRDPGVEHVVCATDAGREGELIFRYVYEKARCQKKVKRLWISSLTPAAIKKGMSSLKSGTAYDALAAAAKGRSQADWLVGMNLSRAYTLLQGETFSVGRVQTPTLAMLVARTQEIARFVPEDYLEVIATFATSAGAYVGVYYDPKTKTHLPPDGEAAKGIVERAHAGEARVEQIKKEMKRRPPPLLYDLTELQRHANRLFGFSAKKTLQIAQRLYEKHKLISYPRTDSRHLSTDVAKTLNDVVSAIREPYEEKLAPGTGERTLSRRFVNDDRVTDHHAIIPTPVRARALAPGGEDHKIYDLICRRLLSAWHGDHVASVTTVMTAIQCNGVQDVYRSSGTLVAEEGWRVLEIPFKRKKRQNDAERYREQTFPSDLKEGSTPRVQNTEVLKKKTKPPRHFTEATLLTAMETAGKSVEDKALSDAMRENGLGTPATRAAIIETLLARQYVERKGKSLIATDKGIQLIDIVHNDVKSPDMTGLWEHRLREIERGQEGLDAFMRDIEAYVRAVVGGVDYSGTGVKKENHDPLSNREAGAGQIQGVGTSLPLSQRGPGGFLSESSVVSKNDIPQTRVSNAGGGIEKYDDDSPPTKSPYSPFSKGKPSISPFRKGGRGDFENTIAAPSKESVRSDNHSLVELLKQAFGFDSFRPHQEAVCRAVSQGENVLLVMPTGAGKSLCYQLPGIARQGTTLVISPLIALMEDQTVALRQKGFAAERIHSGMSREASREVCRHYLRGELHFLFVAPERLGVPGFPEMLAKRVPALIAVDEAHCISHWGHDFRPDYRMLKERLQPIRTAPVIAMTATATPLVQKDIVHQLGMPEASRYIHGFRRTNIAVEVAEMPVRARGEATLRLLKDPGRRPAIVYAPTRKKAEQLADELASAFPCAAYHAGMNPALREKVQSEFLDGRLEVIVATIAFGMGIDKSNVRTVVHVALPSSIESYYQEIGRAGRDGLPSRAVLMYTYADIKTHEFFLNRDYPEPDVLGRVFEHLTSIRQPREDLQKRLGFDDDAFGQVIEKLWIHGGAEVTPDEQISKGSNQWRQPYLEQRRYKEEQLGLVLAFAQSKDCRMLRLVRHFGDQEDVGGMCGQCDVCDSSSSVARQTRGASDEERQQMVMLLKALQLGSSQAKGRVYREVFEGRLTRNEYEALVESLFRAGFINIDEDTFEKGGRTVAYQRLLITRKGYRALVEKGGVDADVQVTVVLPPRRKKAKRKKRPVSKGKKQRTSTPSKTPVMGTPSVNLVSALKAWRLTLARKRGIPAFRILTDRTLNNIAVVRPKTDDDLLQVSGVGDVILKKHGKDILTICKRMG